MKNEIHYRAFTHVEVRMIGNARSFSMLLVPALEVLQRMSEPVHMVSGPISTGGVGSLEGNIHIFKSTIEHLAEAEGLNMFSQLPFQDKMIELAREWHEAHPKESYCMPILSEFYEPIFASGHVECLHFIHGWEQSKGSRWEHDGCSRWKIERRYLLRQTFSPPESYIREGPMYAAVGHHRTSS